MSSPPTCLNMTESGGDGRGRTGGEQHADKRASRTQLVCALTSMQSQFPPPTTVGNWPTVESSDPRRRIIEPASEGAKRTSKTLSISTHKSSDLIAYFSMSELIMSYRLGQQ